MQFVFLVATSDAHVPIGVTVFFGLLLVALIASLALEEKLHAKKSVIASCFALLALLAGAATGILPFDRVVVGSRLMLRHSQVDGIEAGHGIDEVAVNLEPVDDESELREAESDDELLHVHGHRLEMPVYVPGVDWGVIAIIFGSSLFVDIASKSGLFTWIAIKFTKASRGDPLILLVLYGIMTVTFSAVLNNVTAMIIVGSLTAVSLDKLERTDKLLPFLLIEGLLTNVGGLLTLISSVPNILVGTTAGIDFATFFFKSVPYVVAATAVTLGMGAWFNKIHRLRSDSEKEHANALVAGFDEQDGIESVAFFRFSAMMLILFIVTIAATSILPWVSDLQMGYVALAFAAVMLIRYKSEPEIFYRNIDWDLLGFFTALFAFIYVLEHAQVLVMIGHAVGWMIDRCGPVGSIAALLVASAGFSSVTDNIPLAAMLAKILAGLGTPTSSPLWWSVIFGANLGGNLTPIGSASTLVAVTIMHRHNLALSFGGFVRRALPYALVQIALAVGYVMVVLGR